MLAWGIVMTLHGVIHDYGGLISKPSIRATLSSLTSLMRLQPFVCC